MMLPKRVFRSPLIECANFLNGNSINIIKLYKPYANGQRYAVYDTTGASNGMFKSYERAKQRFESALSSLGELQNKHFIPSNL